MQAPYANGRSPSTAEGQESYLNGATGTGGADLTPGFFAEAPGSPVTDRKAVSFVALDDSFKVTLSPYLPLSLSMSISMFIAVSMGPGSGLAACCHDSDYCLAVSLEFLCR